MQIRVVDPRGCTGVHWTPIRTWTGRRTSCRGRCGSPRQSRAGGARSPRRAAPRCTARSRTGPGTRRQHGTSESTENHLDKIDAPSGRCSSEELRAKPGWQDGRRPSHLIGRRGRDRSDWLLSDRRPMRSADPRRSIILEFSSLYSRHFHELLFFKSVTRHRSVNKTARKDRDESNQAPAAHSNKKTR